MGRTMFYVPELHCLKKWEIEKVTVRRKIYSTDTSEKKSVLVNG